ncbi:MAG: ATP-dependent endonuclease [Actinomycetota bacterium]|nr:ATP-dependent endonuclease [Actinomycetota bacterium]
MPSSTEPATEASAVILVEGASDQRAVEVLALRRGRDLAAEGVAVVAMGGITNLGRHLDRLGPGVVVTGLYDRDEEAWVQRALARRETPVALHVCDLDLEDELIRALGVAGALEVVEERGDAAAWATLCRQPFHRERPADQVLHRFLGTTSGRKIEYAGLLTAAAYDRDRVPTPLDAVLSATAG